MRPSLLLSNLSKLALMAVICVASLSGFADQAKADTFNLTSTNQYLTFDPINNQYVLYPASTSWIVTFGYGGYSLKAAYRAGMSGEVCLNARTDLRIGSELFPYSCVAGDAGQVFAFTPNPGQIKFKADQSKCVAPIQSGPYYYNNEKLVVAYCSNSPNFTQQ
jgi:hypothetical protein